MVLITYKAGMISRSQKADEIIISLQSQIEEIKSQAPLPVSIQETILKQENAQLRNFFTISIYTHKLLRKIVWM